MEDYAAKMQLKTTAALREYVTGYAQYREEAVLAAFDELRRRALPAPEEATLRPLLEPAAATARAAAQQAEAEAAQQRAAAAGDAPDADTDTAPDAVPTGPALYSPIAIIFFSIFSPFLGGVLLGVNLGLLKRWAALGGLVALLGGYFLLNWQLYELGVSPMVLNLCKLPVLLLYILWFWPRYVAVRSFRSRSWLPPLLLCIVVVFSVAWYVTQSIPGFKDKTPQEQQEALQEFMQKQK